eukprot:s4491_g5.t1
MGSVAASQRRRRRSVAASVRRERRFAGSVSVAASEALQRWGRRAASGVRRERCSVAALEASQRRGFAAGIAASQRRRRRSVGGSPRASQRRSVGGVAASVRRERRFAGSVSVAASEALQRRGRRAASGVRRERRSVAASEASQRRGFAGSVAASQRQRRAGGSLQGVRDLDALCSTCDAEHLVCDLCSSAGITWTAGNTVANKLHGHAPEDTLEITGFFDTEGRFIQPEEPVQFQFQPASEGSRAGLDPMVKDLLTTRPDGLSTFLES